ncbi:DNA-binding protein [Alkalihalobacterium elongatum]|uniref:DNA-binding protein n=1 Tax=Alkalihalobacterium elongatum TaxID=2675466 RepID=UPI001C1FEA79|nr:DNA-binding protein [Alkalihalobacterium elongatum]
MDYIWLAMGIAIAGYLIGDGLKNFKNPNSKNILESLDEDDEHELIKESNVHHFIGISKEDAKNLLNEHPNIPHIIINNNVYYPKAKLREWLMKLGS